VPVAIPGWVGLWFAVFPTVETLLAQTLAAGLVVGSYFVADYVRIRRPRRQREALAALEANPS
jgi:high-affinity iron transporter